MSTLPKEVLRQMITENDLKRYGGADIFLD